MRLFRHRRLTESRVQELIQEALPKTPSQGTSTITFYQLMKRFDVDCRSTMLALVGSKGFPEPFVVSPIRHWVTVGYDYEACSWNVSRIEAWEQAAWDEKREAAIRAHIKKAVKAAKDAA